MTYSQHQQQPPLHQILNDELNNAKNAFDRYNHLSGNHVQYAEQACYVYDMVMETATTQYGFHSTPMSTVIDSFLTIAKTGLSINPSLQLCFLKVTWNELRQKWVTQFDFGYRGYLKLAARSGTIKAITADVIYGKDNFIFNGTRDFVTHQVTALSPSQRGDIAGGYCTSELVSGGVITTTMTPEEMLDVERSAQMNANSVWNSVFKDELRRKTLIRRHWKTLSTSIQSLRDNTALSVVEDIHQANDEKTNTGSHDNQTSDMTSIQARY